MSAAAQSVEARWWAQQKAAATAAGKTEDHILILRLAQPDYDSDTGDAKPVTMEALRELPVVLCPLPVEEKLREVSRQLGMVGMDSPDDCLRMLGTGDSYEGQDIVKRHLSKVEGMLRRKEWPEALTYLAAVTVAIRTEDFWFMDTDVPEVVEGLMRKMNKQWEKLWARSNAELGGVRDADRDALQELFEDIKADVEEYCGVEL